MNICMGKKNQNIYTKLGKKIKLFLRDIKRSTNDPVVF